MKQETATTSGRTGPAKWVVTIGVPAAVVSLLGVFLVVGSMAAKNHALSAIPTATSESAGTTLSGHPAPAFTLTDQNGQAVSLASLRGHPVVITFMDATCQQECPIEMQFLNQTAQFLGPQRTAQIEWVSMTINPDNTPAQAADFLTKNQAAMRMSFLLGTQSELAPLWKAYGIQVIPQGGDIAHTSGLYILDRQGREVEWVDVPFDSRALSADLTTVLGR